jgi:hypothetical protein
MSRSDYDGDASPGRTRHSESPWTKASTIATVIGLVVAVIAAYFAFLALPSTPPGLPRSSPEPQAPPYSSSPLEPTPTSHDRSVPSSDSKSSPTLDVSPVAVNFGDNVTIVGSGFEAADGLQVRLFHGSSISYPVGPDQVVAAGNGRFTIQGPVVNPGWCGSGIVAVFAGSASAIDPPPPLSQAIVTARLGVIC